MFHARAFFYAFALLLVLASTSSASMRERTSAAPESDPAAISPAADSSLAPPARRDSGVEYRTGGVGKDERDALLLASRGYPLKLVFAGREQTEFVAEVKVRIFDSSGATVLEANDAGPLFFAELPPGQYRIAATLRGQTLDQKATVTPGKQTQAAFYW
jgi:hypothetical protein